MKSICLNMLNEVFGRFGPIEFGFVIFILFENMNGIFIFIRMFLFQ